MGQDRISELPDSLLTQILLNLTTKDSIKTSTLSKRWEFLWLTVPDLDLNTDDFNPFDDETFPRLLDKFLEFNHESRLQKFKIKYDEYRVYLDRFPEWIGAAVNRGIRHLDVETHMVPPARDYMPQSIYKSDDLVSLKLVEVGIEKPEVIVSLPCLKIMHLDDVLFGDDPLVMEKVISGCPVLEDLTLIRRVDHYEQDVLLSLRVRSKTLKRFCYTHENSGGLRGADFSFDIDGPGLEYFKFNDNQADKIVVKNLKALVVIDIDSDFNVLSYGGSPLEPEDLRKRDVIRDFFTGVSSVRQMIISQCTLEVLYRYSKLDPIPKFDSLYCLEANFSSTILPLFPVFLESCPNLKTLLLDFSVSTEPEELELTYVPQCLLTSLECVEIKELIMEEETGKNLVRYLLENSVVLKKVIMRLKDSSTTNQDSEIFKELLEFKKGSCSCQIIIH